MLFRGHPKLVGEGVLPRQLEVLSKGYMVVPVFEDGNQLPFDDLINDIRCHIDSGNGREFCVEWVIHNMMF